VSGQFRTFKGRRERISVDALLASAAIPTLFRSVQAGGAYGDGLFSQNPPVRPELSLDFNRKHVTGDRVAWTVAVNGGGASPRPEGRVEARFRGDPVVARRLTAGTTAQG
jgi:predicted acylesterase/phospholipase RssA